MKSNRCPHCQKVTEWRTGTTLAHYEVGALVFEGDVPAPICASCGNALLMDAALSAFEQRVARWLALNAPPSPEALRFMRKVGGLKADELAEVLDTDKHTISRWENGKQGFNRAVWGLVATIALEASEGRTTTRDRLRSAPRVLATPTAPIRIAASQAA